MPIAIPRPPNLVTIREMRVDEVDSGLPRLTFDCSPFGGPGPVTYSLAPDAVRGLVDALSGVVRPEPGECRVSVKIGADLPTLLRALREVAKGPMVADSPTPATDAPTAE